MREKSSATPISHKNFDFERFVPYLINHIGGRMAINFARAMQGSGIGYTMWRVLGILWWHKSLYLVEIAELANFELSTLSRIIAELELRKLVRRSTNRRRGKSFAVELTSRRDTLGRALVNRWLRAGNTGIVLSFKWRTNAPHRTPSKDQSSFKLGRSATHAPRRVRL